MGCEADDGAPGKEVDGRGEELGERLLLYYLGKP